MNKLIRTAPPSALGRWLARSVAWTLACASGFWPVIYWVSINNVLNKGSKLLFMGWLTSVQILAWEKGITDFSLAYHSECAPAEKWLKALTVIWLTLLISILVWTTLLCAFGWMLWAITG